MRAEDRKRLSKVQQRAKKDRLEEERLRQKYERETPLVLGDQAEAASDTSEVADS